MPHNTIYISCFTTPPASRPSQHQLSRASQHHMSVVPQNTTCLWCLTTTPVCRASQHHLSVLRHNTTSLSCLIKPPVCRASQHHLPHVPRLFRAANVDNWRIPESKLNETCDNYEEGLYGTGGFAPYGFDGIMAGAAMCFYGFVGFDVIASTGGVTCTGVATGCVCVVTVLLCCQSVRNLNLFLGHQLYIAFERLTFG